MTLNAGRELDAAVAEAKGLPVVWAPDPYNQHREGRHPWLKGVKGEVVYDWSPVPPYSTDLSTAWQEIAERFIDAGCAAEVYGDGHTGYSAFLTSSLGKFEGEGQNPAEALCRAQLACAAALRQRGEGRNG